MTQTYQLTVKNMGLFANLALGAVVLETPIVTDKPITEYFNPYAVMDYHTMNNGYRRHYITPVFAMTVLFREHEIAFPVGQYMGKVIGVSDETEPQPFIAIGHKGDESRSIEDISQLYVYWKKI